MSVISIGLLVAFIVFFVLVKRDNNSKWKIAYESPNNQSSDLQQRYMYLKRSGIHCRLVSYAPNSGNMMGMQATDVSSQLILQLQVHKKDIDQALQYLSQFNE